MGWPAEHSLVGLVDDQARLAVVESLVAGEAADEIGQRVASIGVMRISKPWAAWRTGFDAKTLGELAAPHDVSSDGLGAWGRNAMAGSSAT